MAKVCACNFPAASRRGRFRPSSPILPTAAPGWTGTASTTSSSADGWTASATSCPIGTLPKGNAGNLDDPALDPFWQTASDLKAAVFMHPMFLCGEPRLADYDLVNAIGRLADTSIAVSRLLFSGHLLKFPGMKFVVAHGGAALPYALGRLARNHANSKGKYADPRKGFEAMYFDSCVFDADSLEYLAKKAGSARIMLGSDQPFPIGDPEPKKIVEGATFNEAQRKGILGDTAQSVFRVRPDCWCPR